jgi:hypothetical protein
MLCHVCGVDQTRKYWADSQWEQSNPNANGFYGCCRSCGLDKPPMTIEELKEQLAIIDKAAAVVKGLQVHMAEFIDSMGRQRRKDFNHRGALPSRPGDPKHWQIQGAWSFDPGNLIYGRAFAIAFPALIEERSSENLGDILEAYFAYFGVQVEERWGGGKWSQDVRDVVYAVWDCRDDSSTEKLPWLRALRRRLYGNDLQEIDCADFANPWLAWQYENITIPAAPTDASWTSWQNDGAHVPETVIALDTMD